MKVINLFVVLSLILSLSAFAQEDQAEQAASCDVKALKSALKEAKGVCKGLKGAEKKTCKSDNKQKIKDAKDAVKACKKSSKKSKKDKGGDKYCKKISKLASKKGVADDLKQEIEAKAKSGTCTKEDFKDLKGKVKAAKKASKGSGKTGKCEKQFDKLSQSIQDSLGGKDVFCKDGFDKKTLKAAVKCSKKDKKSPGLVKFDPKQSDPKAMCGVNASSITLFGADKLNEKQAKKCASMAKKLQKKQGKNKVPVNLLVKMEKKGCLKINK